MLLKQPARRPTMAQVAAEIGDILLELRPLSLIQRLMLRFRRIWRRRGMRFAIVGSMILLLLILALLLKLFLAPDMVHFASGHFKMGSDERQLETAAKLVEQCKAGNPRCGFYKDNAAGEDGSRLRRETPQRVVDLDPFAIDRYEVTNADFASWLEALQKRGRIQIDENRWVIDNKLSRKLYRLDENLSFGGVQRSLDKWSASKGMKRRPVVAVTWYGADLYCREHDKRLPTEAEWEYAATSQGIHPLPYGDAGFDCNKAIVERGTEYNECAKQVPALPDIGDSPGDITDQGVHDLAGSVSEWVADYYLPHYPPCPGDVCHNPQVSDPASPRPEDDRHVYRGGAWPLDYVSTRATGRSPMASESVVGSVGFRCARSAR
jgi:formylglycine-generating enzyme required for sulfatase activity